GDAGLHRDGKDRSLLAPRVPPESHYDLLRMDDRIAIGRTELPAERPPLDRLTFAILRCAVGQNLPDGTAVDRADSHRNDRHRRTRRVSLLLEQISQSLPLVGLDVEEDQIGL